MRENSPPGTHAKRLDANIRNSRVLSCPRIASAASRRDVALVRVVIRSLRLTRKIARQPYRSLSDWQLLIHPIHPELSSVFACEVGFWRKRRLFCALMGRLKESNGHQPYPETMTDFNFVG